MIVYNDKLSYEITEDGYDIYNNGNLWITQHGQYSKPFDAAKTYEENCLLHLKELTAPAPKPAATVEELSKTVAEQDAAICELYEMMNAQEVSE